MSNRMDSTWSGSAVVALVIGLIFVAVGTETPAAYNSCIADPACLPSVGELNVSAFLAVVMVGIAIAVGGAWAARRTVRPADGSAAAVFPP
ncbi:MAG: hypothetical protein L3K03_07985 [Thermoplasmata archaeon]|nr:hypothetical protein [Thermoplasmata archaeon]